MTRPRIPRLGLYALTPDQPASFAALLDGLEAALRGGAGLVQYRRKSVAPETALAELRAAKALCEQYQAPLIVNDSVELSLAAQVAGVHLGKDDALLEEARRRLGPSAIIGVSCYDSLGRAIDAERGGASYVAFGSLFPSTTKPGAVRCPVETLTRAREELSIPVIAIGGITPDNAAALIAAGATHLAVCGALFDAADPHAAARAISDLFQA